MKIKLQLRDWVEEGNGGKILHMRPINQIPTILKVKALII